MAEIAGVLYAMHAGALFTAAMVSSSSSILHRAVAANTADSATAWSEIARR